MQAASSVDAQRGHRCPGFVKSRRPQCTMSASTVCVQIGQCTQPFCVRMAGAFEFEFIAHLLSHSY
jgi:hypothetical protein